MVAYSERVARLEAIVGVPGEGDEKTVIQALSSLRSVVAKQEAIILQLKTALDDCQLELKVMKKAAANSPVLSHPEAAQHCGFQRRVPEPSTFGGDRSAKEVENFIWDMEQFFLAAHVPAEEQVVTCAAYLVGDAKLWWRMSLFLAKGHPPCSWEVLKAELRNYFIPEWASRRALYSLKQTGSVHDYVKAFSAIMLEIHDMTEECRLFQFLNGLQQWAQMELRRQDVRTLKSAMMAANALLEVPSDQRLKRESKGKNPADEASPLAKESISCFICGGPHRLKVCPMGKRVAAGQT